MRKCVKCGENKQKSDYPYNNKSVCKKCVYNDRRQRAIKVQSFAFDDKKSIAIANWGFQLAKINEKIRAK